MTALELASHTDAGPGVYEFRTRDGLHSGDAFREAELAALETAWDLSLGDLLVVQANYGVVGTVLSSRATSVTMTETSARAADCCRANVRRNGAAATVELHPRVAGLDGRFDTAVYVPKPYAPTAVGKQRLAGALERLRPDGRLVLAGREDAGFRRYRDCLERLGTVTESVSRGDVDVAVARRPATVEAPRFADPRTVTASVDGRELELVTAPGLFSAARVDDGTRLLAESVEVEPDEQVLDLCCGYGPLGTVAALDGATVTLTDDDARATECAERTLAANRVEGRVVTADCLEGVRGERFDTVLCNPPTHAGRGVLRDLFSGVESVLDSGGRVAVVHHRALDLSAHLSSVGTVVANVRGGEHVVEVVRT